MSWNTASIKPWYLRWWMLMIFILIATVFFGWPKMRRAYRRWDAARRVRHAAESVAQGDFRRAMLEARSALETNPADAAAIRIMARALEGSGAAAIAAQWRNRLDSLSPGDHENLLAWASDSVKAGDTVAAERILGMLKPEPKDDATFHAAAATVAMVKRDAAGAEQHWAEAVRIDPKDDGYRLRLAGIRLGSRDSRVHDDAVKMLTEISARAKSAAGAEALRALLADATNYRDWGKASEYADALVAAPNAMFSDKLVRLATLRSMKSNDATGYLTELREAAISVPSDFYLLLMWMNQHDLALLVSEWSRSLPPDVIGAPPVCVAVADAYVRASEWQRLKDYLNDHPWAGREDLRRTFLARALERLGETEQASQEWKDGVAAARGRSDTRDRLERMVRLAIGWGWEQRAQEVMWTMAGSPNCPRWMLDALWLIAIENSDTVQLQKLAGILAQCDSKSVTLRNNYAFYSLLVRAEDGDAHRESEKLFNENPGNATVTLTRALSLFQQGKASDAAALTGNLPTAELRKPEIALYHSIFLTAAGKGEMVGKFLPAARDRRMLPEEKAMLERARLSAAKAADESSVAETSKAMRAAKAARDVETEKAIEAARVVRAAKMAKELEGKKELDAAKAEKATRAAQSIQDILPPSAIAK